MKNFFKKSLLLAYFIFCFSNSVFASAEPEEGNIDDIFVEIEIPEEYRVKPIYKRDDSENYIVELKLKHKKESRGVLKLIFDPSCTHVTMVDFCLQEGMSDIREMLTEEAIKLIKILLVKKRVNDRVILTTSTWFSEDPGDKIHNFYKSKGFSATHSMFGRHYALYFF